MQKPDFGFSIRTDRVEWTEPRVEYVRYLAEQRRMSARAIAVNIGLQPGQWPRINAVCRRNGIQLNGQVGRPSQRVADSIYRVEIPERFTPLLLRLAHNHALPARDVASLLVAALFEQGETFLENMLDLRNG